MPVNSGPLTERQTTIIGHVRAGLRYRAVARELGISEVLVRHEVVSITRKLRCITLTQAIGVYATAQAYLEAADLLEGQVQDENFGGDPDIPVVNRILFGMAGMLRARAARLLPQ